MLTQMEAFSGLFVATTNQVDDLDEACMRRFDAKVRFDYLRAAEVCALLIQTCAVLGIDCAQPEAVAANLDHLTPGDFAVVLRQARFRPVGSLADLAARLRDEVVHKRKAGSSSYSGSARPIGFSLDH